MKVVEKFVSINGESRRAGELAVFIRFKHCNLHCCYCDTKWANEKGCEFEELTIEEIVSYIISTNVKNVTLTGGEPLLQPEMGSLLKALAEHPEIRVEIETNGSISIAPFCNDYRPSFTMDYKLPESGSENDMCLDNFCLLKNSDTVKFVCSSIGDLEKAKYIIEKYNLINVCAVYISPVFGKIEPADMVSYMIENNLNDIKLQIQMHKVIWDPNLRGV